MKIKRKKIWFYILWGGIIVIVLPLLLYGMYMAGYEYTFYKEYKTVKQLSVFRDTPWGMKLLGTKMHELSSWPLITGHSGESLIL